MLSQNEFLQGTKRDKVSQGISTNIWNTSAVRHDSFELVNQFPTRMLILRKLHLFTTLWFTYKTKSRPLLHFCTLRSICLFLDNLQLQLLHYSDFHFNLVLHAETKLNSIKRSTQLDTLHDTISTLVFLIRCHIIIVIPYHNRGVFKVFIIIYARTIIL